MVGKQRVDGRERGGEEEDWFMMRVIEMNNRSLSESVFSKCDKIVRFFGA